MDWDAPENWGNSGVKILDPYGYEVQIMDSAGFTLPGGTNPLTVITGVAVPGDPPFYFCAANLPSKLMLGDICGAIYHTAVPAGNPVLEAVNQPRTYKPKRYPNAPPPDLNTIWNEMHIYFMSARYRWDATKKDYVRERCSTITVYLNGQLIHDKVGLVPLRTHPTKGFIPLFDEKARLINDSFYDEPNRRRGWCKASGIILFQEHDSAVEFKDIRINPSWKPQSKKWQRKTGCLQRAD